jgi:hypothetical protein
MDYQVNRLSDYSDESLLNELRRVANLLGKTTLYQREFNKHSRVGASTISHKFGSWENALEKAGLSSEFHRNISDEKLFAEIERLWNQLGRQPFMADMRQYGKFSSKPYFTRFGSWIKAIEAFVQWKGKSEVVRTLDLTEVSPKILIDRPQKPRKTKKVEYGEPIEFLGLRHEPLNEQGVVYLFGVLSRQLGFIIEAIRTDFPDCEGKRQIQGKQNRWEQVSIEFEYKSSNFKEHGHDPTNCDLIICWEHDWKDCPIEAISLKEIYRKFEKVQP